jgi:hypothetical protein
MNFRNLTGSASPNNNPAKQLSGCRARRLTAFTLLFLGGILLLGTVAGLAKEKKPLTRTVSGTVFDEKENTIQGATVELTDRQSGKVLDIYSQEGGHYQFAELSFSHDYTIKAMFKGMSSEVRQVSSIDIRTRPVMNLTLVKPGK